MGPQRHEETRRVWMTWLTLLIAPSIGLAAPGVSITQSGGTTAVDEEGATADSYTVVLEELPSADVEIVVDPDNETDIGAGKGAAILLTFSVADWDTPQTVTVTAVDDNSVEGPHTSTIIHTASSSDPGYDGIAIADVVATVADNDTGGVTVNETGGTTRVNESGATTDTYEIVLDSRPSAPVTITLNCDAQVDLGAGPGGSFDLVIGASSWDLPRDVFVTAVDDSDEEGLHISTVTHVATSSDPDYNGITIADVAVEITDDDAPGVKITESGGATSVLEEGPTSDTYTIELLRAPAATVTITIDPDDQTDLGAGPGIAVPLDFTVVNWSIARQINVTAVDDAASEGPHTSTITHAANSSDPDYDGFTITDVIASVADNDTAGVTVSESGGSTDVSEAGPTSDTYTIVLDSQPSADVMITVDPDPQTDVGAGGGATISLTFTTSDWNTPQTVTVTAIDDAIGEGPHTSTITHTAGSGDTAYDAIAIADVTASVTDNESAGVSITQSGGTTAADETGPTSDTYTIVLDSQPTADVTITVDPDTQTDLGSGPGTAVMLTFTSGNWASARTVTVTAVDDDIAEGGHTSTITHAASSGDPGYDALPIPNVIANLTDNDSAGVSVVESGGTTAVDETGPTSDTYTIVLTSEPVADVTVAVDPDPQTDAGSGPGTAVNLTFTAGDWDTPQTVTITAVDDAIDEDAHTSTITHTATSSDGTYDGATIADVVASVTDNDSSGVTINESGGTTAVNETGPTTDSYTVVLDSQPTADVVIRVDPDQQTDLGSGAGVAIDLTFTAGNWDTPQSVPVTAVDDALDEDAHTSTITHTATSGDGGYDGIAIPDVLASVTDNDTAGVTSSESGGSTSVSEAGPTSDTYTVVLDSQPTAGVTVSVDPDAQTDLGAGAGVAVDLVFTTGDWNTPQTITVTAVDDAVDEGPHASTITKTATSTDGDYNGLTISSVVVAVTDNDTAGVTVAESDAATDISETGPTSDTYTLVLNTQPTADVMITVDPDAQSDAGAGAGTATTVTFTAANWSTPQTITLTAVDDAVQEGGHTSTVTHTAGSADGNYNGIAIADVVAAVTDNDTPGVTVSESGGSTDVDEAGPTTDTYTVVLDSQPVADVTITVDPDADTDLGSGAGSAIGLTFTPGTWNAPQTVSVTAVDDPVDEDAHTSTIAHTVASADGDYDGIALNVVANITDDDTAGVTLTEPGGATGVNETGPTSDTYTIVLDTRPTADVTVTVDPDGQVDLGSGPGVAESFTYTTSDWNVPRTVVVTAVDDAAPEGPHTATMTHAAASTDGKYNSLSIGDLVASVADNDVPGVTLTESDGTTAVDENGPTVDGYTLVLDSEPSASVTITIDPDQQVDLGSGPGVAIGATFTTANWQTPQFVTVTAADDAIQEGAHNAVITHVAGSTDGDYDGIAIPDVTVSVTDDDTAGVTLSESGGSTDVDEAGPTSDTYTIVLDSQPVADVLITIDPDDQTDLGGGPGTALAATFTDANWNLPQTVTVTAVDDALGEGPHTSTITHAASSADGTYDAIAIATVIAVVADNEMPGVLVTESDGVTDVNEAGPTSDTYTVVLQSQPTAGVTIQVDPDPQTDVGNGPGTARGLTFTAGDWDTPQTVTVTAVDDALAEGPHGSTITHTAASADGDYNGVAVSDVNVTVADDDTAGIRLTESGGATAVDETGPTTDSYTVVLDSQPTSDVMISVDPDPQTSLGAGADTAVTLTFTAGTWDSPQTVLVTAEDDADPEGPHTSTITHTVTSADGDYNGLSLADVVVSVIDNDLQGVNLSETFGTTEVSEEGPTSDTYTVALTSPPSATVTLTLTPDAQTQLGDGPGVPISLSFSSANWSIPRTVVVTAEDDSVPEGVHNSVITHSTSSGDPAYDGIAIADVIVSVTDNDSAVITITESDGSTGIDESGPTADSYTIVLGSQPTGDVVIEATPDPQADLGAGPALPVSLTFTNANWAVPQTVTVTAVDDAISEGGHTATISHTVTSADPIFDGITIAPVSADVTDNDAAAVRVTQTDAATSVTESGTTDSYSIVLESQPLADVHILVMPDEQTDLGAGGANAIDLSFTAGNWNVPQVVAVAAVDDRISEGPHASAITHRADSPDAEYDAIAIAGVAVSITDNDTAGVTVDESGGATEIREEGPTADTYTIMLDSQPAADVTITCTPDAQADLGAGPALPLDLRFTAGDWNVPRTIVVTAVDDDAEENRHTAAIQHAATSADPDYDGRTIAGVIATVIDNDAAGVTITETSGSTEVDESGPTSDTYTIVLDTRPEANVTISIQPDQQMDLGAGRATAIRLTFTPANWATPQVVTVTAFDDADEEGAHISRLVHDVDSAARAYAALTVPAVLVVVLDDDLATSGKGDGSSNAALIADAGEDIEIFVGETARLSGDGSQTSGSATIVEYFWDLRAAGGLDARGATVEWTFDTPGDYALVLTVLDDTGRYGEDTVIVTVLPQPPIPGGACGGLCGPVGLTTLGLTLMPLLAMRRGRRGDIAPNPRRHTP